MDKDYNFNDGVDGKSETTSNNDTFFTFYKLSAEDMTGTELYEECVADDNIDAKYVDTKTGMADSEQEINTEPLNIDTSDLMLNAPLYPDINYVTDDYIGNTTNNALSNDYFESNYNNIFNNTMGSAVTKPKNTKRIAFFILTLVVVACIIFVLNKKTDESSNTSTSTESISSYSSTNGTENNSNDSNPAKAVDVKQLDIKQPESITQKLEFVQNDEAQIREIKITTEYDGTCAIVLTEVYQDSYFELGLYDEYGNQCSQVTVIDDDKHQLEYDGVKAGNYNVKVKYYGHGTPSCLLTIYKANKSEDISEYMNYNGVIITDSFSAPFMRNYYSASVKETSTYLFTSESGEYFEIDILDKYGKCVKSLNGLQKDAEVTLDSGDYTFDIHCCSTACPYTIKILKK